MKTKKNRNNKWLTVLIVLIMILMLSLLLFRKIALSSLILPLRNSEHIEYIRIGCEWGSTEEEDFTYMIEDEAVIALLIDQMDRVKLKAPSNVTGVSYEKEEQLLVVHINSPVNQFIIKNDGYVYIGNKCYQAVDEESSRLYELLLDTVRNHVITDKTAENNEIINEFVSWCPYSDDYLEELCDTYELEKLTEKCQSDYEKVQVVSRWVSGLWKHDGMNEPEQNDPFYILDQVINHGKQYRCVEYGTVISGCLNALGLECRQLNLKTKDVETLETGAGHVGCEVYLEDYEKWVFIDGQWGAIPIAEGIPLNAYEFGAEIRSGNPDLTINWVNNVYQATDSAYFQWIEPYLYYMDSYFKNMDGGYTQVMFVPDGGKNVTVFQRKYDIHMDYYLKDVQLFYYH